MRSRGILVLAAALLAGGCAAPISTDVRVTDPAPRDLRVRELAVLPLTVDPGLETYGREVAEDVAAAIMAEHPSLSVLPPTTTLQRLQNANLGGAYAELVAEYERSGELNPTTVADLGAAVGAAHLLNLRLLYGEEAGYAPMAGADAYQGQGLRLVAQLWDGRTGAMLWRSVGEVSAVTSDLMRTRELSDLIDELAPRVAERLPVDGGGAADDVPVWRGPDDRNVFLGASGLLLVAFFFL